MAGFHGRCLLSMLGPREMNKGKVVVVTGANRGIGRATSRYLAGKNLTVIMACRDIAGSFAVKEEIKKETGNDNVFLIPLDLSMLGSVRKFVETIYHRFSTLDVLINNAGTFSLKKRVTQDGFDYTLVTNYLGPFLLTNLLLPLLGKAPEARIINVSSNAYLYGQLDIDRFKHRRLNRGFRAYAASKLGIVIFTLELAERLRDTNITANALHPGHIATNMWHLDNCLFTIMMKPVRPFLLTEEEGAQTTVYLALSDEVSAVSGSFFEKKKAKAIPDKIIRSNLRRSLWAASEELVKLHKTK